MGRFDIDVRYDTVAYRISLSDLVTSDPEKNEPSDVS